MTPLVKASEVMGRIEAIALDRQAAELAAENEALRRAHALQNELIELSLANWGIEALIQHLAETLGNPVTLADPLFHLIASSPREEHGDRHRREAVHRGGTPRDVLDDPLVGAHFRLVRELGEPTLFPAFPDHGMDQRRMMAPVIAGGEILGYVTVLEEEPFDAVLSEHLAHAARILAFELLNRRIALETELHLMTDFLGDLLSGRFTDRDAVVRRAGFLGLDLFRAWAILIVKADDMAAMTQAAGAPNPVVALQRLYDVVRRRVRQEAPADIVAVQGEAIIVLHASVPPVRTPPRVLATRLHDEVGQVFPSATISIAIGGLCQELEHFPSQYAEAHRALDVAHGLRRRGATVSLDEFGLYGLLFRREDDAQMQRFTRRLLDPLIEYDTRRRTALLDTLDCYLKEGAALRATARRLGVHLNTLRGRLFRIEQLTGVDLSDPAVRFELQLALEIYRIAGAPPS